MKQIDLHQTVINVLTRANAIGCDTITLSDMAPHVPYSEWLIAEAIEAFFREGGKVISKIEIALSSDERLKVFKNVVKEVFKVPLADSQNCKVKVPLPEDEDREPLHVSSSEEGEKERKVFEIKFPPKIKSKESLIIAYKALRSLAATMNEKSIKLKALAAYNFQNCPDCQIAVRQEVFEDHKKICNPP